MRKLLTLVLTLSLWSSASAQQFDFYAHGPYRGSVPRVDSLLGYSPGARQTTYDQQQRVLDRLIQAAPDRVRTEVMGRTVEGRVMRLIIISAPENLARLDAIRDDLAALADPRKTTPAEARAMAGRTPVVALIVHSEIGRASCRERVYVLV